MDEDLIASISVVESVRRNNNEFGTSFIVHQDGKFTYFLTCAHVVEGIGIADVQIEGLSARVIAIGVSNNLDLAVLCVSGLSKQSAFELQAVGEMGDSITVIGIQDYGKHRSRKPIRGYLGVKSELKKPKSRDGWIQAWEIKMETDDYLQPGFSGSPVIHNTTGKVLGIVSHSQGAGGKGLAISIEAISELWKPGMPSDLLQSKAEKQSMSNKESAQHKRETQYNTIQEKHLQKQIDSLQKALDKLGSKIEGLQNDRVNETRREEINRLGSVIDLAKKQQAEIEMEIGEFITRLQSLRQRVL